MLFFCCDTGSDQLIIIYNLQYLCVHLHFIIVESDYAVVELVRCICDCILSLIYLYHNPH